MEYKRAHIFVSGRVQGVWFRASTVERAELIGQISGWVRNLPDSRVEVMCEGPTDLVERLIGWLWQGPPQANVSDVQVIWSDANGDMTQFTVRR